MSYHHCHGPMGLSEDVQMAQNSSGEKVGRVTHSGTNLQIYLSAPSRSTCAVRQTISGLFSDWEGIELNCPISDYRPSLSSFTRMTCLAQKLIRDPCEQSSTATFQDSFCFCEGWIDESQQYDWNLVPGSFSSFKCDAWTSLAIQWLRL